MALLTVDSLTKRFEDVLAVDDVSFDVADGEFVSILGPSGSGKSTILRMVAGFEAPTSGSIVLDGEEVVGTPPFERDVNMVFQNLALFPHLTVAENIQYGLKQTGVPRDEREARTRDMLEMVDLEGYGDRSPDELSGGEQQRVALARALVNEPKLALFDEPLSSLDRKLRQRMQRELQRIQSETGITFLYVTHDQEVAMSVSDRLVVLNDGRIEQAGSVEDLYEGPASQFVADFIGDVNTVYGNVTAVRDEEVTVSVDGDGLSLPTTEEWATGDRVAVCVRPHNVRIGRDDVDGTFSAEGTVTIKSNQGSTTVYTVETDRWGELVADARDAQIPKGATVSVAWDAADAYLFPADGADPALGADAVPAGDR
ncbi:MAG: ABC transporter ATP-binding protein [Halanaeroarchaeum sp.]